MSKSARKKHAKKKTLKKENPPAKKNQTNNTKEQPKELENKPQSNVSTTQKTTAKLLNFANQSSKAIALTFATILLVLIGFFLYHKFTQPQSIAEILPAEKTIGFLEINIDPMDSQTQQAFKQLKKTPQYQEIETKVKAISLLQNIDLVADLAPWIGRRAGIALFKDNAGINVQVTPLLFIENRSQPETLKFMKSLAINADDTLNEKTHQKHQVYNFTLGQTVHFTFINNYLVIGRTEKDIHTIIESQFSPEPKIASTSQFHRVRNNLPSTNFAFAYSNFDNTREALSKNSKLIKLKLQELKSAFPYLSLIDGVGVVAVAEENKISLQYFNALDPQELNGQELISTDITYRPHLTKFIEKDIAFFAGGRDLATQIQVVTEILRQEKTPSNFENDINNLFQRLFGAEVSLTQDIFPLLDAEVAFSQGISDEFNDFKFIIELNEPTADKAKFRKAVAAFKKIAARFVTKKVERILPDGTQTMELVANPEAVEVFQTPYSGYNIESIKMGDNPWGVHFVFIKHQGQEVAIISSKLDSIKKTIDLIKNQAPSLNENPLYINEVTRFISHADALVFFNFKVYNLEEISPYLAPLRSAIISSNIFADGVSTIYTFNLDN